MKTERWQQISQLYDAALARDASERAAFLRNACAGDLALQREVEALLAREGESFLEVRNSIEASDLRDDLIGQQLGTYKVLSLLGAGGMGEVYRARDTKLGRDIAIKVLPSRFTADRDRLARFEREARILATLNHPHIGAIYGFETAGSVCALVLELVEGPTLADRLTRGPIPPNEALCMARQIAEALDAAHEKGIVHRDLKPANVVINENGLVKVLDFGLAKAVTGDPSAPDLSQSPALTLGGTQEGVILGTAAYMSPEQARGLTVDKRTDVWAFGCVLYEMLTGRGPFLGPTVTDTLAAILEREPAWDALPGATPPIIRRLLQRCLEKDPKRRLRDLADARMEIEGVLSGPTRSRVLLPWAMAVVTSVGALTAVGALTWYVRTAPHAQTAAWRWFAPSETPSVAVLPFSTIGDGDQYFADGITEAVTTELGRVGGLRVIASNSTFAYRDKTVFRDIGRELGVGLVVKGSVQRADGRVRIDVSLVDTRDDTALWSERYSRELTDILTVQDDISRQIATTLSKRFGAVPAAKSPSLATTNPDAYDAYLRGVWQLKARSANATIGARTRLVTATEELERAVAYDPNFALARATLASAYTQLFFYQDTDPAFEQKAFLEIQKALAINPDQAEAYLARAQLTWNLRNGFPHEKAITDLRRALSINPNLADAYVELGKVYYHIGQTDKALDACDQAQRLDPSSVASANRRISTLIDAGRLEEVRHDLNRHATRLVPINRADALLSIGQPGEALQALSRSRSSEGGDPESGIGDAALLAVVYARLGRREDAERVMASAIPAAENPTALSHVHHAQFHIGRTLVVLGRHDEAVRWLTKAVDEGYQSYPRFSTDPSLASLKSHAGFAALLARLRQDEDRWHKTL